MAPTPPPPYRRFVENKGQTPIQPAGYRPVEVRFPRFFVPELRSILALATGRSVADWLFPERAARAIILYSIN